MSRPAGRGPLTALALLALVTLGTLAVAGSTSTTAYSPHSDRWDGTADLADAVAVDTTSASSTGAYTRADPGRTTALVLSPDRPYGVEDLERLREFVRDGGLLVVAEDVGAEGNRILAAVGAEARFDGRPLRDERVFGPSPAFPVASTTASVPLGTDLERVVLNHPTAVVPNGGTVLATTGPFAYLDADRDGELDVEERLKRHAVATAERVGAGRVVAVGDPSLFLNAMLDRGDNRAFAAALLSTRKRLLVDHSHGPATPPLVTVREAVAGSPGIQFLGGGLAIGAIAFWARRPE